MVKALPFAIKSGLEYHTGIVELREIKDKLALRGQLERWARIPSLNRIIVSHGKIVSRDAKGVLDRLAESLAA